MKKFTIQFLGLSYLHTTSTTGHHKQNTRLIALSLIDIACIIAAAFIANFQMSFAGVPANLGFQLALISMAFIITGLNTDKYELIGSYKTVKSLTKYLLSTFFAFVLMAAIHFLFSATPVDKQVIMKFFGMSLLLQWAVCLSIKGSHRLHHIVLHLSHRLQQIIGHSEVSLK